MYTRETAREDHKEEREPEQLCTSFHKRPATKKKENLSSYIQAFHKRPATITTAMAPKIELPIIFMLEAAPRNSGGALGLGTLPLTGTLALAGGATGESVVMTGGAAGALVVDTNGTSGTAVTGGT